MGPTNLHGGTLPFTSAAVVFRGGSRFVNIRACLRTPDSFLVDFGHSLAHCPDSLLHFMRYCFLNLLLRKVFTCLGTSSIRRLLCVLVTSLRAILVAEMVSLFNFLQSTAAFRLIFSTPLGLFFHPPFMSKMLITLALYSGGCKPATRALVITSAEPER